MQLETRAKVAFPCVGVGIFGGTPVVALMKILRFESAYDSLLLEEQHQLVLGGKVPVPESAARVVPAHLRRVSPLAVAVGADDSVRVPGSISGAGRPCFSYEQVARRPRHVDILVCHGGYQTVNGGGVYVEHLPPAIGLPEMMPCREGQLVAVVRFLFGYGIGTSVVRGVDRHVPDFHAE